MSKLVLLSLIYKINNNAGWKNFSGFPLWHIGNSFLLVFFSSFFFSKEKQDRLNNRDESVVGHWLLPFCHGSVSFTPLC